jgi:hypothetical protein
MTHAEKRAEQEYPDYDGMEGCYEEAIQRAAYIKGWEADKWIRVEDELPKDGQPVNGYFPEGDEAGRKVAEAIRSGDNLISAFPNSTAPWFKATHWQSLPEPPKTK